MLEGYKLFVGGKLVPKEDYISLEIPPQPCGKDYMSPPRIGVLMWKLK